MFGGPKFLKNGPKIVKKKRVKNGYEQMVIISPQDLINVGGEKSSSGEGGGEKANLLFYLIFLRNNF